MPNFYQELNKASKKAIDENGTWLSGVPAIVADNRDPENQHRIKVIIPSIDEDMIFDDWARQFVFCLGNGFGSVFIPSIGSEVVLFGELGQKFNLFYASLYNEEMLIPSGFNQNVSGVHVPNDLRLVSENETNILAKKIEFLAQELAELKAQNVTVQAEQSAEIKGNQVKINADGSITIKGNGSVKVEGENVSISGANVKIQNRIVQNNGMPI